MLGFVHKLGDFEATIPNTMELAFSFWLMGVLSGILIAKGIDKYVRHYHWPHKH